MAEAITSTTTAKILTNLPNRIVLFLLSVFLYKKMYQYKNPEGRAQEALPVGIYE
jgi:hypothetical protein